MSFLIQKRGGTYSSKTTRRAPRRTYRFLRGAAIPCLFLLQRNVLTQLLVSVSFIRILAELIVFQGGAREMFLQPPKKREKN